MRPPLEERERDWAQIRRDKIICVRKQETWRVTDTKKRA